MVFPEVSFVQKHETMPIKFVMDKAVDGFNIITIVVNEICFIKREPGISALKQRY